MGRGLLLRIGLGLGAGLLAAAPALGLQDDEALGFERTPPRLALIEGEVSFWRPDAGAWAPARVNTPLAAGDEIYAAGEANVEVQIGPRAWLRAGQDTQLGLTNLEPDFLQVRVTAGTASLDLRSVSASQTFELATPHAAFTVERTGYYRLEVEGEATRLTVRRGGRAVVTPPDGPSAAIASSEQVVVTGSDPPAVETYVAPELDAWDRWNYARTDDLLESVSARYVPAGIYGVADLDHYGDWRVVATYGAVWVPRGVPAGWVPYSTGLWIYDPYYAWTWVDAAPWGWAPYHYGRWVYVSGYWAWCPGPAVARPFYAPALVAFYSGGGVSIGITIGTPYVGWVALGWGEPLLPWWGPPPFRGRPHWARWGGPRFVNRVAVEAGAVIRAREIHSYEHAREHHAVVTVPRERFGRRSAEAARFTRGDVADLGLVRGELPVEPDRSSLVPARGAARRPPPEVFDRPVVATRRPRAETPPSRQPAQRPGAGKKTGGDAVPRVPPPARVVEPPREGRRIVAPERPPFGRQGTTERAIPPPAPRYEELQRERGAPSDASGRARREAPSPPAVGERRTPAREVRPAPSPSVERRQATPPQRTRELPGEPANRVWRRSSPRGSGSAPHGGRPQTPSPRQRGDGKPPARR